MALHLISGADSGGAKTHVLSLLGELSKTGEGRLLCLGDGPLARQAGEAGIHVRVLSGGLFRQWAGTQKILQQERCDILHCHGARANLIGVLLRGRIPARVVSTVHSDHRLDYLGRPLARAVFGTVNALLLRRMDALICVSGAMAALYRRRGFSPVYAIHNGADFSLPLSAPSVSRERDAVVVGTAARLDPVKDLPTLLRGFAAAARVEPRLRLWIAGSGREEKRLRTIASSLGLGDRVRFFGWVENVEGFTASLDIAALTSLSETFPYVLLTAARYALPVVSTDVGGIAELVLDGESGLLIPPGNVSALADSLLCLAADEALRHRMGRALRARGEDHFTLEHMAARHREIYNAIRKDKQIALRSQIKENRP